VADFIDVRSVVVLGFSVKPIKAHNWFASSANDKAAELLGEFPKRLTEGCFWRLSRRVLKTILHPRLREG
jgi:hypothetical protein